MGYLNVKLRTGKVVSRYMAERTMSALFFLLHSSCTTYIHYIEYCKDESHELSDFNKEILKRLGLIQYDGTILDDVRETILAAIADGGLNFSLVSLIEKKKTPKKTKP